MKKYTNFVWKNLKIIVFKLKKFKKYIFYMGKILENIKSCDSGFPLGVYLDWEMKSFIKFMKANATFLTCIANSSKIFESVFVKEP